MPVYLKRLSIYRIIDANYNRAKEGLRVCEEITRFVLDNRKLTSEFKNIRHGIDSIVRETGLKLSDLLSERQSSGDVGRKINSGELNRENLRDIFFANIQRVKESIRVLEEFSKLINKKSAFKFKEIRYGIYSLEKKVSKKLSSS